MSQASLNPGPGTLVRDALAAVLLTMDSASSTATGDWTNVEFPWLCAVWADMGTIAGSDDTVDIQILGADDASGTNPVVYGEFSQYAATDDDVSKRLVVQAFKPYMQAVATIAGSSPDVTGTVTVRTLLDRLDEDSTA
jgi:hypothetical protein